MTRRIVIADHAAIYPDPVRVERGAVLVLDGREDIWDGHRWLWATDPEGRAGWVPDTLISPEDTPPRALRRYSALELTCRAGELLELVDATHGWGWCRSATGAEGWLPLRNLGLPPDT
ncbi:hypothetical protein FDP22_13610 [Paroceanicella profunda]|uniref:SH3 domain-containing protein n=1 Tax=Paroceanicella profunda TaxID=2579971 RepID=A0A5B8FI60_9RHOB|nr:SH3 domain-containing protein [Paroceanicella profunda]QDL92728.1 hypothetical protein FDP22_13610 [Paroceanicella profunda]